MVPDTFEPREEAPERGGAWFTLALAHYRNGDWPAADDAVEKSIKLSRDGQANAFDWALLAMIRVKQGRIDDARRLDKISNDWIASHDPKDNVLLQLAAESSVEIQNFSSETSNSKSTPQIHP